MTAVITILFIVSALGNVISYFITKRFIKRTIQFDELFENVMDDIDLFNEYFESLLAKSTFSNSPDIMHLNRNMTLMKGRFDYYAQVFNGVRVGRALAPKEITEVERPIVVD